MNFRQELVALFGSPVTENPTQAMMEAAFRADGLEWRYLTIEVAPADLGAAVRGARAMGFRGFHCTIPHKVAVIEHLDEVARSARLMGAVNCVVARGDRLVGENTDGRGFLESLRTVRDPAGADVVVLGAGGAARAIAVELALAGAARITIVNRDPGRGRELCELLSAHVDAAYEPWSRTPLGADLVVNATSIGLPPDDDALVPLDVEALRSDAVVADVIPAPETPLLRQARRRGLTVLDGHGMLVEQGAISFALWTGLEPRRAVMDAALRAALGAP